MEEINFGLTDVQILKDEIKLAWKKCEESNYTQEAVSRAASLIKALHGKVTTEDEKAACIRLLKELKKRISIFSSSNSKSFNRFSEE